MAQYRGGVSRKDRRYSYGTVRKRLTLTKEDLTEKLAKVLDVSPAALNVPDIESYVGIMHTLFTLEDLYGLNIDEVDGEPVIRLNKSAPEHLKMVEMFLTWLKQAQMWRNGKITKEDYDQWRYKYPELDKFNKRRHKVTPSTKLNDAITDELMEGKGKRRNKKRHYRICSR